MPFDDYANDAILPDGFDPSDESFTLSGFESAVAAETEAPTTEPSPQQNPVEEAPVSVEAPTTEPISEPVQADIPQPEAIETPAPAPQLPPTIRVRYNHEERELGLDEAAVFAQKGMNYDKLEQKNRDFEAKQAQWTQFASQLGYESVDAMMSAAQQNFVNRRVKELVDAGNTEAMAKFLVEQEMAKASQLRAAAQEQPAEQPTPQQPSRPTVSPEREAELREFVKAYPGVTKLPAEVVEANRKGTRLLVAYERYQNRAAQNELAILRQNQAAASKAPVTGATAQGAPSPSPEAKDPFLMGFDSAY